MLGIQTNQNLQSPNPAQVMWDKMVKAVSAVGRAGHTEEGIPVFAGKVGGRLMATVGCLGALASQAYGVVFFDQLSNQNNWNQSVGGNVGASGGNYASFDQAFTLNEGTYVNKFSFVAYLFKNGQNNQGNPDLYQFRIRVGDPNNHFLDPSLLNPNMAGSTFVTGIGRSNFTYENTGVVYQGRNLIRFDVTLPTPILIQPGQLTSFAWAAGSGDAFLNVQLSKNIGGSATELPRYFTTSPNIGGVPRTIPDLRNNYGWSIPTDQNHVALRLEGEPVPEPATMIALGGGLLALASRRRVRG